MSHLSDRMTLAGGAVSPQETGAFDGGTMATTERPARTGGIDKESLRRRYAEERDKRLRPDGNDQYVRITGEFGHYVDDPHTPRTDRAALTDHRTVVWVGGGLAGLGVRPPLREAGGVV